MSYNRFKNKPIKNIVLIAIIMAIGFYSTGISDFINKKYDNNDNSEVIDKGQDNIPDIDIDSDKPTVTIDACDVNTVAKANSVANISKDGKYNYFGYTDSEGRLYKTTADVLRHKSDTGRGTGQMCDSRYPSNSNDKAKKSIGFVTSGGDDRGHAIGDQFDGVSNSFNITSQDRKTNQNVFVAFENYLAKTISEKPGSVTDFEQIAHYNGKERRPYKYTVKVKINGKEKNIEFINDGSALKGEYK